MALQDHARAASSICLHVHTRLRLLGNHTSLIRTACIYRVKQNISAVSVWPLLKDRWLGGSCVGFYCTRTRQRSKNDNFVLKKLSFWPGSCLGSCAGLKKKLFFFLKRNKNPNKNPAKNYGPAMIFALFEGSCIVKGPRLPGLARPALLWGYRNTRHSLLIATKA